MHRTHKPLECVIVVAQGCADDAELISEQALVTAQSLEILNDPQRLMPILENVERRNVVDDNRVEVKIVGRFSAEPSAVSSSDSRSFQILERTIRSVVPDAIVAPYLVVVATDARHYGSLSRNVFRFLPLRLTPQDVERMHGSDERIAARDYESAIRTYRKLIIEAAGS